MKQPAKIIFVALGFTAFLSVAAMAQSPYVTTVQYGGGSCSTWQRECANLWGWRTPRWQACMRQPQALYDCGRGGGGGYGYDRGPRQDLCANWRRQCANLWGFKTRRWFDCMNQPQAVSDCSY